MQPLLELRQDLKDTQDPEKKLEIRDFKRRDGKVIFFTDGTEKITPGPYKIEFRKEFLKNYWMHKTKSEKMARTLQ